MLHRFRMFQEPNRTILIIRSESADLSVAQKYMTKNDWSTYSTYNLHDAINYIIKQVPQFIMVSIDHPNKNIKNFTKLLMQSFPDRVIVFAEKARPLTYHHFNELGGEFNIYPPVSGPSIERTLLAYYKKQVGPNSSKTIQVFKGPQWNKLANNEEWALKKPKAPQWQETFSLAKAKEMLAVIEDSPAPLGTVTNKLHSDDEIGDVKTTITEQNIGKVSVRESLISLAAKQALEQTVRNINPRRIEEIKISSKMSCIFVDSTRFSGYLVAALGKDKEPEDAFLEKLRERILHFLKKNGEKIKETDHPASLVLKKVDFKNWAGKNAEFLRSSIHDDEEVSIAFFPRRNIRAQFEDSTNEKMAKIKLEEIKPDTPVEFNLYIYLKENNRYVRYTQKGSKLLSIQKERLLKQGLKHMHLFKEDIPELNKFRAQNFLNEKIERFNAEMEQSA
ncbi:hypothetical protein [Bdellovibrio sp. HCB-110]|uniref:hypothetical protein n=1 Tax=Bdellovibrio sp. HCB-110 TaxID=3391182 RepID=UPI0039B48137